MFTNQRRILAVSYLATALVLVLPGTGHPARAQLTEPAMLVPNLDVRTVIAGLNQPTTMAFLGVDDIFVLEKATGQVKRVVGGVVSIVLDLAVNSASERGLLGIALHPAFPANPGVYLYWTESTTGSDSTAL
ncbi:MAG TPA: PQQ-dependent sugar dehydrogenase, partial [Vicinamibacterales bacterium]|nr:PQQ-dependent sugar dehydrogenase [Vicinamibacterales bacterium]